jgi:hypothetical protein
VHDPTIEVEAGHLGEFHLDVLVRSQDVPERRSDLASRQDPGRDLIQERLEEVMRSPVHEGDVDRQAGKEPACGEATEPASHDDDSVPSATRVLRADALPEPGSDAP